MNKGVKRIKYRTEVLWLALCLPPWLQWTQIVLLNSQVLNLFDTCAFLLPTTPTPHPADAACCCSTDSLLNVATTRCVWKRCVYNKGVWTVWCYIWDTSVIPIFSTQFQSFENDLERLRSKLLWWPHSCRQACWQSEKSYCFSWLR